MDAHHTLTGARAVTADGHRGVVVRVARRGRVVLIRLDETGSVMRSRVERLRTLAPAGPHRSAAA